MSKEFTTICFVSEWFFRNNCYIYNSVIKHFLLFVIPFVPSDTSTSNTVGLSLLILIRICRWLFRCRLVELLDAVVSSIFTTALLFTIAFLSRNKTLQYLSFLIVLGSFQDIISKKFILAFHSATPKFRRDNFEKSEYLIQRCHEKSKLLIEKNGYKENLVKYTKI